MQEQLIVSNNDTNDDNEGYDAIAYENDDKNEHARVNDDYKSDMGQYMIMIKWRISKTRIFGHTRPRPSNSGLRFSLVFWMSLYKD